MMDHPIFDAIEGMPEKPPRYLKVDKTYPEWTVGEMYEGKLKFVLVQQDMSSSLFEVIEFTAQDEKPKSMAEEIAEEYKKSPKSRPMIVPSPSE